MEIDVFQMFRHVELAAGPALVIMGCVCPPVSHRDSLGRYINKYQNYNPNGYERRMWYDAFAFEAVVGQMSRATVVQIVRAGDSVKIGATPAVTAPLAHVPGVTAAQCKRPPFPASGGSTRWLQTREKTSCQKICSPSRND